MIGRGEAAEPVADLTWTGNQFIPPERLAELVRDSAGRVNFTTRDAKYGEPLREALADALGSQSSMIATGVGSSQLLDALIRRCCPSRVVDVVPNFHLPRSVATQAGLAYVPLVVREKEELVPAIMPHAADPRGLLVLSSPRNPLGYEFGSDLIETVARGFQGVLVIDQAYGDFGDVDLLPLTAKYPNLILVRSFSKGWGVANLRIGYAVGQRIDQTLREHYLLPYNVGGLSLAVAASLVRNPHWVRQSIRDVRAARSELSACLAGVGVFRVWPSDANFVCIEHNQAVLLGARFGAEGILVRLLHDLPGYPAGWPTGIRLTVPPRPLLERVMRLLRAFAGDRVAGHVSS